MEVPRAAGNAERTEIAGTTPLLEHESTLCASAVALVASGGARRVWLVGMRSGQMLAARALRIGTAADVSVTTRWWPDEEAFDLLVQRHG